MTGITLWQNDSSPVFNPLSGEINLVATAAPWAHYQLAASYWADRPLVNGNMLDFAYFDNSLYNGTIVAVDSRQATSPLGFPVHLQTRYVTLSTNISTGMYDLQDCLAGNPSTDVFLGACVKQPTGPGATPVYGFLDTATRTQFYATDPKAAAAASANPRFASGEIVFNALPPSAGPTNFRRKMVCFTHPT